VAQCARRLPEFGPKLQEGDRRLPVPFFAWDGNSGAMPAALGYDLVHLVRSTSLSIELAGAKLDAIVDPTKR
jgi:hypothetical protein